MNFIDQTVLNEILNNPNQTTASDSWTTTQPDLLTINQLLRVLPQPKNLLIKIHPAVFEKIKAEFGPLTQEFLHPEVYRSKDPNTKFYVTEKASLDEIEVFELPQFKLESLWSP